MSVRIVFMGTPDFAVPTLLALAQTSQVVGVFTRPDAVSGRGGSVRPSPVKIAAEQLELRVMQPSTLRDESAVTAVRELDPELLVVAAYGLILPRAVLETAPLGAVNVHASLLPRWRGAAPIQRAILAGDTSVGVSIMRMEEGLDTGPYCLQVATPAGDADARQLTERLARMGADALTEALPAIVSGSAAWTPQDDSRATYADKVTKADVAIGPELVAQEALRHVRASLPAAPCRVTIAGRNVTVVAAGVVAPNTPGTPPQGEVAASGAGVLLGTIDGALLVHRLKPDGKAEMQASDWLRGVRDLDGATWGRPV